MNFGKSQSHKEYEFSGFHSGEVYDVIFWVLIQCRHMGCCQHSVESATLNMAAECVSETFVHLYTFRQPVRSQTESHRIICTFGVNPKYCERDKGYLRLPCR